MDERLQAVFASWDRSMSERDECKNDPLHPPEDRFRARVLGVILWLSIAVIVGVCVIPPICMYAVAWLDHWGLLPDIEFEPGHAP